MEIIVIDDNLKIEDPLIIELGMEYQDENVKLFTKSEEGLLYIKENLKKELIVILDINFPYTEKNGHQVLEEIRKHNKLIPVIIWSAKDGSDDDFTDFINNHALFYVKQTGTIKEIISRVKDAEHRLNLDVATAIENWLEQQQDKQQTLMVSGESNPLSVNDLIKEIRLETEKGQKIEESILRLTISLLFRSKESI
jgi:DNA-binding response OmpR family regulator